MTLDYSKLLEDDNMPKRIDYLSLDIDPPIQTLAALKKLPLDDYRFSVITFETDYYNESSPLEEREKVKAESRQIFEAYGYVRVYGNVSYLNNHTPFEDWYLDSQYFSEEVIKKFMREDDTPLVVEHYMFDV
tara:strand:- start:1216 stop:1611 length:396 start_codon:yes stop_codon:yes gene_type:complete